MGATTAKSFPIIDSKGEEITVVHGWNHGTVADGCELTNITIEPICDALNASNGEISAVNDKLNAEIARAKSAESAISSRVDVFYDEYTNFSARVEQSATNLNKKIDDVSAESLRYDTFLSGQIDTLKAATDVIAVFGTYEEFTNASAGSWQQQVTDNDFVKVLNGKGGSKQVYYEWHDNTHSTTAPDWKGWSAIGELDPYYSKSEVDNWRNARFTETSAKYALSAADSQKLGGTAASNIINSAMSGANASAWLNNNAYKYISDVLSSNMKYIDGTLVTATNGSARKLTISLSGWQTIGDGTYITGSSANKLITLKPADSFIGSAQSGKSAYDWITTKSATLSAGEYIKFTSAAQNTMGITVTGIYPHRSGNCITVDAVQGQSYSSINLSSDIFVDNLKSSAVSEVFDVGTVTTYLTANSKAINFERNSPHAGMYGKTNIDVVGVQYSDASNTYSFSWIDLYNGLAGNYVHASATQTIKVATATTALTPSVMEDGYIYIV